MKPIVRFLVIFLALVLVATACGNDDDATTTGNDGTDGSSGAGDDPAGDPFGDVEWILVTAVVDGEPLTLLETHPVTLRRTGSDVGGTAACNLYFGTFNGDGRLFTEGFGVTEMACDPPASMQLESDYLAALGRTTTAERDNGDLVLTGGGVELRFEATPASPDASLTGTEWELDTLIEGDAAMSLVAGTEATLRLEGSEIVGSDGCNSFSGSFELDGDTLVLGALRQSLRGCPEGVTRQAQHVTSVLGSQPTVSIEGASLTLTGPDGLALVYRAS